MLVTQKCFFARCSECQRGEHFKHARTNGRSNCESLSMAATDHTTTTTPHHNTTTPPHHTTPQHNTPQHTTQQVHLDNLFQHEASNSPTNEGPAPTHSGPQSKCFLHKELSGRVITVIVTGREMKRERETDRQTDREIDRKKKERDRERCVREGRKRNARHVRRERDMYDARHVRRN